MEMFYYNSLGANANMMPDVIDLVYKFYCSSDFEGFLVIFVFQ